MIRLDAGDDDGFGSVGRWDFLFCQIGRGILFCRQKGWDLTIGIVFPAHDTLLILQADADGSPGGEKD